MHQRRTRAAVAVHHRHQNVFAGLVIHLPQRHRRRERHLRLLVIQQVAQRSRQVAVLGLPRRQRRRRAHIHVRHRAMASTIIFSERGERSSPSAASAWIRVCGCFASPSASVSSFHAAALALLRSPRLGQRRRRLLVARSRSAPAGILRLARRRLGLARSILRLHCRAYHPQESRQQCAPSAPHLHVSYTFISFSIISRFAALFLLMPNRTDAPNLPTHPCAESAGDVSLRRAYLIVYAQPGPKRGRRRLECATLRCSSLYSSRRSRFAAQTSSMIYSPNTFSRPGRPALPSRVLQITTARTEEEKRMRAARPRSPAADRRAEPQDPASPSSFSESPMALSSADLQHQLNEIDALTRAAGLTITFGAERPKRNTNGVTRPRSGSTSNLRPYGPSCRRHPRTWLLQPRLMPAADSESADSPSTLIGPLRPATEIVLAAAPSDRTHRVISPAHDAPPIVHTSKEDDGHQPGSRSPRVEFADGSTWHARPQSPASPPASTSPSPPSRAIGSVPCYLPTEREGRWTRGTSDRSTVTI